MPNVDELFEQPQEAPSMPEQPFDKEAWGKQKQEQREGVYALAEQTAQGLADPAAFRQYLDVQGQFPLYSVNNALLIAAQMPTAKQLRSFDAWNEQGASITKGEKGIRILEPGKEYTGKDEQQHTSVNVKTVFDVTQTDAVTGFDNPAMTRADKLLLRALIDKAPMPCRAVDGDQVPDDKIAHFDGKEILVRRGCEAHDLFREIAMEMAGAKLGDAFQARCAAYILCRRYNVSPPEIAAAPESFKSGDTQAIRAELGKIRDAADAIGKRMYHNLEPKREARA